MKLLKVFGIVALGVGAIVVAGIVLGWVLHIVVPVAVLFAVGWVAYQVFFAGRATPEKEEPKQLEAKQSGEKKPETAAEPERKALSAEEAARIFDEHRQKLKE